MKTLARLAGGIVLGVAAALLLDPVAGKRRRKLLLDRTSGAARHTGRRVTRGARGVQAFAYGRKQRLLHRTERERSYDDATLARKVETTIFRDADAPKGQVDVSVAAGIVALRGEVERPELIEELAAQARSVQGVRGVENLLHLPGSPAPMHQ
jgi:osmotically-inducible protein OsmY